jgi:hypothetical protein
MANFYGSGVLAGSGAFFSGINTAAGIPQDLSFYRTTQDGIYVFHWGFLPAFISPSLFLADFDLQLDTSPLFTSPNLVTFTKLDVITYQNGNVRKGYAVPVAARLDNVVQTWYAQVRTHSGSFVSDWSDILIWTIPQKVQQQYAENLMISLPDSHVYGKGDLLKPVNQRNSNLYVVENMYANQFDAAYYENFLTQTDNYIDLCRDEFLQQNFGVLFNFSKPSSLQFVDYRWILKNMISASLVGSTNEAIILSVQAQTGVPPEITNIRDLNDFFLITIQDNPTVPGGPQTVFHTSQPYIDATLVVEDITTGLLVPSSAYTTDGALGTWTMNVPTSDTLQATFDVGNPNDPFPVIFDSLSGATILSGLITFTNGSINIGGFGTHFTTELAIGNQITDPNGIYLGTVDEIADDTHLQLVNNWSGPTEVITGYKLQYTDIQLPPPILWDQSTLKAGVLITVFNPGDFILV